jgi:hypothetical protein
MSPRAGGFPSATRAGYATRTTAELHLYADGTSGSDANDGLTVGTPKKTLAAVVALVPSMLMHNVYVHLTGTFVQTSHVIVSDVVSGTNVATGATNVRKILLLGQWDTWTDVGGGTKTATGSSVSSLVVAGAGWVVDAYAGYMVKVLTGAAVGQVRMIQGNTADTITPVKNFSVDPGVGATFDIVRPATEITDGGVGYGVRFIRCNVQTVVGRLYLSGKMSLTFTGIGAGARIENVVSNSTASAPLGMYRSGGGEYSFTASSSTKDDGTSDSTTVPSGVSVLAGTGVTFNTVSGSGFYCDALVSKIPVNVDASVIYYAGFGYGSRLMAGLSIENSHAAVSPGNKIVLDSSTGAATTKVSNSSGIGVSISSCRRMDIGDVDISGCASHGIAIANSMVKLSASGATTGTGNTGAGVYAHSGSVVHTKSGTPPTITGTVGDLSTDGTTQASTWAAIEAGTPVASPAEMTMAKKVV